MRDPARSKVSVVIPCFNRGQYLEDTVSSCLEAWDGPIEVIVVDDGSTDPATERHLEALRSLMVPELVILRQENAGPARARNRGLARSTGDYVQFLDSDDLLLRNKIVHQIRHLTADPSTDASICDFWTCDDDRLRFTLPGRTIAPFALSLEDFLFKWERGLTIPIHTALFRRRALGDEPWPEVVRGKEDWLFWVRLKLRDVRLSYIPLRGCVYRIHGQNMTREWSAMGQDWLRAAAEIERWLGGSHPDFSEASRRHYVDFYATLAAKQGERPNPPPQPPPSPPPVEEPPVAPPSPTGPVGAELRRTAASISVVIPVFNHARHLRRCILSAHHQTLPPGEIVVVDDASTDAAVRPILEELAREIPEMRLRLLDTNQGISAVQNLAVDLATGEFIAFLDCDDALDAKAIEAVARCLVAHPEIDYVFTDRYEMDADGRFVRVAEYGGYPPHVRLDRVSHYENLLDAMVASHLKVVRRSRIIEVGGFDPRTSGVQDWDLALKVSEIGRLHYLPQPLYWHRVHGGSVTLSRRVMMFRLTNEVRRRHQGVRARKSAGWRSPPPLPWLSDFFSGGPRSGAPSERLRWDPRVEAWRDDHAGVVVVNRPRPSREAFRLWREEPYVVFAIERDPPLDTIAFLREFNSYFDLLACADEAGWGALHRYVWDARALRVVDELLSEPTEAVARAPGAIA